MKIIHFPGNRLGQEQVHEVPAFPEATSEWLLDLQVEGRAEFTLKGHKREIARFGKWLKKEGIEWQHLTPNQSHAYLRTRAHLCASSRGSSICSLQRFYAWAFEREYISTSPTRDLTTPQRPEAQPKALRRSDIRKLIRWLASQSTDTARRDEAVVLTGLYAGLRAAELAKLDWQEVDLETRRITIRLSKGNHGRIVPMHPALISILVHWRKVQNANGIGRVFTSVREGEPLTPARVGKICKFVSGGSGVKFTAHILRHTFATQMLRASGELYAVSKALGHKGVKQTEIYLGADIEDIDNALVKMPDPGSW